MGKWANRTCYECGITRSVRRLRKKTISVNSGRSGSSFSLGQRSKSFRVHGGRKYYRNKEVWVCDTWLACNDPNYYENLAKEEARLEKEKQAKALKKREDDRIKAEEKRKEEARRARERKKEEARRARERRRKERVEKEIKRQKKNEVNGKNIAKKSFASYEDFFKEISDCENELDAEKTWRKKCFWGAIIFLVISSPYPTIFNWFFYLALFLGVFSSFRIPCLNKRILVLKGCAENLKSESKEEPKEAPKSAKEEAPKSAIDKLIESDDFFNIATTVLAKSIAEIDGKLTKEEYDVYCKNFEIDKEDFKLVEKVWSKDFSPSAFAKELAKRYRKKKLILEVILNNLFFVVEADGSISNKETEMLRNYATIFGLSPEKFERLIGKKKPTAIFDRGDIIFDDPQFDYLDDLEIDDDFDFDYDSEFGEE